jgi:hypothetical protein
MMESTSSQTGMSVYSANAPKVIRKVKDKAYGGATLKAFAVAVGWVIISVVIVFPLAFFSSWIVECFVASVLLGWWLLYYKYASTDSKLEESILFLKFFFDGYSGLHTIARYDTDLKFLEDVFPLKEIHEDGLIQFLDNNYGLLIKFIPPQIQDEDDEVHGLNMQSVIDGLAGNTSIKFIATSRQTLRKPLLDKLLSMMNKKSVNKKVYEYLYSIYEMVRDKDTKEMEWSFCAFFGLGIYDNLQDAIDQMDSEYPGLVDSLTDAGMKQVTKLTDRMTIAQEYRQMALPVVI